MPCPGIVGILQKLFDDAGPALILADEISQSHRQPFTLPERKTTAAGRTHLQTFQVTDISDSQTVTSANLG
jgi:hypothetical protein